MLKFLGLGLLISGLLVLESAIGTLPGPLNLFPVPGLLIILVCGIRGGKGRLPALCLLMGFVQGSQGPAPAGFYILAYLFISSFLHHTGAFFFTEHPLTQLFLSLLMAGVYGFSFIAGQAIHLWPELSREATIHGLWSCLLTAALTPVFLVVLNRFRPYKRRLST